MIIVSGEVYLEFVALFVHHTVSKELPYLSFAFHVIFRVSRCLRYANLSLKSIDKNNSIQMKCLD